VWTIVVVTVSPGLLVLVVGHSDRGDDVAYMVAGQLVLSAVGSLKGLQPRTRHTGNAKQEHQQPDASTQPWYV